MNAVDILKYGQQTVLQTLEGFPEAAVETPGACGTWSVKDIIAHLASYEHALADMLSTSRMAIDAWSAGCFTGVILPVRTGIFVA